jgi:hypothetical protein
VLILLKRNAYFAGFPVNITINPITTNGAITKINGNAIMVSLQKYSREFPYATTGFC